MRISKKLKCRLLYNNLNRAHLIFHSNNKFGFSRCKLFSHSLVKTNMCGKAKTEDKSLYYDIQFF